MSNRVPPKPTGNSAFDIFLLWVWEMLAIRLRLIDTPQVTWEYTTRGIRGKFNIVAGGMAGWRWSDPMVYDKAGSFPKGSVVVIRPTDTIVTAGAVDVDSHTTKKAMAGTWVATQDVAPGTYSGSPAYHVPRWPLPTANNPDATNVYWWLIAPYPTNVVDCAGTTTYVVSTQPATP